jgi:hypothetical protein
VLPTDVQPFTFSAPLSGGTDDKSKPEKNAKQQASSNLKDESSDDATSDSQMYPETDPAALFCRGFTFALRRSATFTPKLTLGVGIYRAVLPGFYIDAEDSNRDKGWKSKNILGILPTGANSRCENSEQRGQNGPIEQRGKRQGHRARRWR